MFVPTANGALTSGAALGDCEATELAKERPLKTLTFFSDTGGWREFFHNLSKSENLSATPGQ
jgi:hypothetical protein